MAKLAINGGAPIAPDGLKTRWPITDDTDRKALLEVLDSGKWCSAGFYYADAARLQGGAIREGMG